ncbi:MAG: undecaprenyl-diphosphate phosphatase [Ruminococcaceae bacterium]|nr:undecaprenyl-diphosphate phosphatase [Oscillospiraceae bacterium]
MAELDVIEILKIIIIGIIEGITEWLPVSSTGHMLIFDQLFMPLNATEGFKEMFFVVIQLGAILAVVVMFWKKLFPFGFKGKLTVKTDIIKMWLKVAVACLPSAVLGIMFDDLLEKYFGNAFTIALMLIVYGIAFIIIEKWNAHRTPKLQSIDEIGFLPAFLIGAFQVLSLIPGTSRSGATIIGALLMGVSRTAAAEFTFFLAIPTMLGASLIKMLKFGFEFTGAEIAALGIGSAVAFIVSLAAVKFLMDFVKRHDFSVFGWYRIAVGAAIILISVIG